MELRRDIVIHTAECGSISVPLCFQPDQTGRANRTAEKVVVALEVLRKSIAQVGESDETSISDALHEC